MKSLFRSFLLLIPFFVLIGCAPVSQTNQPTQTVKFPSPVYFPETNTVTPGSLPTLLVTGPSSPNATQTIFVTLEPKIARATLQPLLQNPMNCSTPCFFGIMPGITSIDEAKTFFSALVLPYKEGKDFYSVAYESGIGRNSYVTLYMSDRLVESIIIVPEITKQIEGGERQWSAYSPETLIKKYNNPSRVFFYLSWPGGGGSEIVMIMYFDALNLIVQYTGENMFPSDTHSPRLCPLTASFDYVRVWMGSNPPNPPYMPGLVSLEKATSLTIDQFSELMLGDPQHGCFTVNGDAFQ